MKKELYLILSILFALPVMAFADRIEGYWYNDDYNVEINVQETRDGIKVKRSDKGEWFYYEKVGRLTYEDHRRNTYKLKNDQLVWSSNDGRQKLWFNKINNRGHNHQDEYYADGWGYQTTCDHVGTCDCNPDHVYVANYGKYGVDVEGRWYSGDRRTYLKVKKKGRKYLKVKTKHSNLYYTYRRIGNYYYKDHRGNTLRFTPDGRAIIKTPHRHRSFVYYRR